MLSPIQNYSLMLPEVILVLIGIALLLVAIWSDVPGSNEDNVCPVLALAGLGPALVAIVWLGTVIITNSMSGPMLDLDTGGHLRVDLMSLFFKGIAVASAMLIVLMSMKYGRRFSSPGEFYALVVLTTLAVCFLSSSADLVTMYLSMEFLSITSYAMAGYYRENPRSSEAALKYFLFGAINSAVMLYGMSLLYGLSSSEVYALPASTLLADVVRGVASQPFGGLALVAVTFTLGGFLFKISAVPFHQWAPDTYQGAPTPFTAFLSVISKVGGLAVLCRVAALVFLTPNVDTGNGFTLTGVVAFVLALAAALSMFVGNLIAIHQSDIKRMLAYSGIAQAGYLLVGITAMRGGNELNGLHAVLIYAVTYALMNLGAFAVVVAINNTLHSSELDAYRGLAVRSPWLAAAMAVFMISLAGVPPAAGWFGKYYIFVAAIDPRLNGVLLWLAILLAVNSVIAAFYYLNVVRMMYFEKAEATSPLVVDAPLRLGIIAALAGTLIFGILPAPLYNVVRYHAVIRADLPRLDKPVELAKPTTQGEK